MIIGAHILIYTRDPDMDRAFVRDVLGFRSVDVGGGWLIFKLPPSEAAFHPLEGEDVSIRHAEQQLLGAAVYLMCADLEAEIRSLASKNVHCSKVMRAEWGITTTVPLPSGGRVGLYQPLHPTALYL